MFLPTTQCLVSGGTSYASVYGALRGLYMAGDLSLCICLCDHEIPLVMSPVIQATGWQIVHILVWPHLMLSFAYSGEPLPTHSMGIFASSPPGGVTPHSARKVQKMPASGISSELRAHQMSPGGVVAHFSPPAGVVAHSSSSERSPQLFPFFLQGRNPRQLTACR